MSRLRTDDGFAGKSDEFYAMLIDAHDGLDDEQSEALNARLLLLLANQIGDLDTLREAIETAGRTG
ncbi:MAG: DUF2783 domain-containing protein [Geminicoccaceae bacterium]|nr:DUF2783 domain-containing protein [Geminicoccaceae bacterium]MCB2009674.1 DUF2783 domain-containing protein [Geminicoccaceae bacterium]